MDDLDALLDLEGAAFDDDDEGVFEDDDMGCPSKPCEKREGERERERERERGEEKHRRWKKKKLTQDSSLQFNSPVTAASPAKKRPLTESDANVAAALGAANGKKNKQRDKIEREFCLLLPSIRFD